MIFVFGCDCLLLLLFYFLCYVFLGYPIGTTETVTDTRSVGSERCADNFTLRIPLLNTSETLSGDPIGDTLAFALNGDETDMLLEGDEENTLSACARDCPSGRSGERDTCPERSEQNTLSIGDSGERDTYPERSDPERSEQNTEDSPGEGAQDELYLADVESLHSGSSGCDISTPRGVPRTPSPDPHAFDVEFEDFDYELEINEFENLRQFDIDEPFDINKLVMDLDSIASIDFSKYV